MHICHINLAKGFRGGERQTLLLIEALARQTITQQLICRTNSVLHHQALTLPSLTITPIRKPFLWHALTTRHKGILHVHEGRSGQYALINHWRFSTPYLITRRIPNTPKNNPFTYRVYQHAIHITCLSQAIKQTMLTYHPLLTTSVIPSMAASLPINAVNVQQFKKKYPTKIIIGHIGALVNHHKGQQYIIEAAKQLAQTHPYFMFVLVGEGKDETQLRQQVNGMDNIAFIGFVDNVGDYLAAFDYFIYPSLEEGLGSTILDAMQFSKPIIATKVGGIPDIVRHGYNGLLIEPRNSTELANAILQLHNDKALQKKLTQQATQDVVQFTPHKISETYYKLYRQISAQ